MTGVQTCALPILKDDFHVVFITKPGSVISPVRAADFPVEFVPESIDLFNEPEWLGQTFSTDTIIVLDGYQFTEAYQRKIKKEGFKLVYIDDLVKEHMVADVVINHAPGVKAGDYSAEPYTQFALGTKYAILRPAFLEAAGQDRIIDKIDTAFVCFGGSDIHDLSFKVTRALTGIEQIKKINVVLGTAYQHKDLINLQKKYPAIHIYRELTENDLINVMLESNLAIVPASTILYEVCAVKMPVISGYSADNQKNIYKELLLNGAIYGIGNLKVENTNKLVKKVRSFIREDTKHYVKAQKVLFDENIKTRHLKLFFGLKLNIRDVNKNDVNILFNWVNEKKVRENALNQKNILYTEHLHWFNKILKDKKTYQFIAEIDNQPVGQVRYEYVNKKYLIDYSVDKQYRGMGFGERIIFLTLLKLKKEAEKKITLIAKVRNNNIASCKVFDNLKFNLKKSDGLIRVYSKTI